MAVDAELNVDQRLHADATGNPELVRSLRQRGAPVDEPEVQDRAATAELLLARGADAAARDQEGRTARERSAPGIAPCLALPSS